MEDFWCLDEAIIVTFSLMTLGERLPLSSSLLLKYVEINCLEIEHGEEIGQKEALNNNKTLLPNLCVPLCRV